MNNMRNKILSLLVVLLTVATGTTRAYEVQIGTETQVATGYFPFYTLYNYGIGESLFLASELTSAGMGAGPITSFSWYATNAPGYAQNGLSIWVANVTDEVLTGTSHVTTDMTLVYTGGMTPEIGWNEFVFNEGDFSWDGTSNLLIYFQRNNGNWNSSVGWQATDTGLNLMSYKFQDGGAFDTTVSIGMGTSTIRPNIIIKGESGGPAVTYNDSKTEATFAMPTYDATATYQVMRDMSVQMPVTVGDGTEDYRIRLTKVGNSYQVADMTPEQFMALVKVHDAIEDKDLVFYGDGAVCQVSIYAIDEEGQPAAEPTSYASLVPGRYVAQAAALDTYYDGKTALSNTFELYQGYEIKVPAGEFVSFYKDEAVRIEDEDAELYTVSSVSEDKAVLSQAVDAMPKNTPMLVYNKGDKTRTIVLIPCNDPDLALTVAPEFKGTLEATTIAASTDAVNNYALNGKQFVWVKNALAIAANKCWLEISVTDVTASALDIVFGNATGITTVNSANDTNGDWYDLNGRKLQAKPTQKGLYIQNGKKVVVK